MSFIDYEMETRGLIGQLMRHGDMSVSYGAAGGYCCVSSNRRNGIFVAGFVAEGDFLVGDGVSRFVIGVLIETVHIERGAGKLEELVDEMLRLFPGKLLERLAECSAADVVLSDHSHDQFKHVRHPVLVVRQ